MAVFLCVEDMPLSEPGEDRDATVDPSFSAIPIATDDFIGIHSSVSPDNEGN